MNICMMTRILGKQNYLLTKFNRRSSKVVLPVEFQHGGITHGKTIQGKH